MRLMPWPSQPSQRPPLVLNEKRLAVPETDVGRGAGARRLADRRLVYFEHAADLFPAFEIAAADDGRRFFLVVLADPVGKIGIKHVARQRRFSRAGNAGDYGKAAKRHAHVDVAQVVQAGADDVERRCLLVDGPRRVQRMLEWMLEKAPGQRSGILHQLGGGACSDDFAAQFPGAGAEIDHVRGAAYGVFVVLDDQQSVALGLQLFECVEQHAVVARMQAYRRLVQYVAHAAQIGAELRGQADALRFAARQRGR